MTRIAMKTFKTMPALAAGLILTVWPAAADGPIEPWGRYGVFYDGPELKAVVGYHQATRDLGEEWLILSLQMMGSGKGGARSVEHGSISLRTPDGKRLRMITQSEYREVYGRLRMRIRRAISNTKTMRYVDDQFRLCDRWFLVDPTRGFAHDEVYLSNFMLCLGPVVFRIPGGVQPGRWRLLIELEESTADIPFVLEVDD